MAEEEPWWKKAAQGVMDTVKDKIVKKEQTIEPNLGRNHPKILEGIKDKFKGDVLHIWELGKFRSENLELSSYGVIFRQEFEVVGMSSFKSVFIVYSTDKPQFAVAAKPKLLRDEMSANVVASEFNWLMAVYALYKEFASSKPWARYNQTTFDEFQISKITAKK